MIDPVRALLHELIAMRRTAGANLVEVKHGDLTTTLTIAEGEIVAARASKPGEPIGRILRRKRMISPEHYVEVLERISEVLSIGENVRFGEVAVGLGYAKAEDVAACLAEQVRGFVLRIFQDPSPAWTVKPLASGRDRSGDITIHVEAVFLDSVRWLDDARKGVLALDAARGHALEPAWDLAEIDARFELTADEAEFVRSALAGDKTTAELCSANAPDTVDVHAVLTALLVAGAAKTRARGAAQVHPAAQKKRVVPPPLPEWARVDADSARRAVVTVTKARTTVPAMRAVGGTPMHRALEAERAFQRGREYFRDGDVKAALVEFERAKATDPASDEYALFVDWSRAYLANEALVPALRAKLGDRAQRVLRQNPKCAFAYFVSAEVLGSEGKDAEARGQLTHALRLDAELFESIKAKRVGRLRR